MAKKHKNRQDGFVFSTNPDYIPEDNPFGHLLGNNQPSQQEQILRIHLVRRKGNKEVTVVKGFNGSDNDLKDLGKMLKMKCGVGGSVKDGDILIQGNHREKVRKLLIEQGYRNTKLAGG
ncbi:MAG TPA: translation initiation factor [Saprospiraceae bacterium]|nr:translation initiation factor [Saprospiraceae bacterium]